MDELTKRGWGFNYDDDRVIELQNKTPNATCEIDGIFYDMQNCVAHMREQDDVIDELYEALENLLKVHDGEGGTKYHAGDIARAALAKARGEK